MIEHTQFNAQMQLQDGVTALHIAVYNKHPDVVEVLVKKQDQYVLNACDRVSYVDYLLGSLLLSGHAARPPSFSFIMHAQLSCPTTVRSLWLMCYVNTCATHVCKSS